MSRAHRTARKKRAKERRAAPSPAIERIPLRLGWLASLSLGVPAVFSLLLIAVLLQGTETRAFLGDVGAGVLVSAVGLAIAVRLPMLLYTMLYDRALVLGEEAVHIPIVSIFQFRSRNVAYRDIVSVEATRKSGSSTVLELTLRDSTRHKIPSALFADYWAALRALQARVPAERA
jgi:hypothetical protein